MYCYNYSACLIYHVLKKFAEANFQKFNIWIDTDGADKVE